MQSVGYKLRYFTSVEVPDEMLKSFTQLEDILQRFINPDGTIKNLPQSTETTRVIENRGNGHGSGSGGVSGGVDLRNPLSIVVHKATSIIFDTNNGLVISSTGPHQGKVSLDKEVILADFTGNANKFLKVNSGETDVEWDTPPGAVPTELISLYVVALSQDGGTGNPTAVIYKNNFIAGNPTWARTAEGTYQATLTSAFGTKTRVLTKVTRVGSVGNEFRADGRRVDSSTVEIRVVDLGGNLVDGFDDLIVKIEEWTQLNQDIQIYSAFLSQAGDTSDPTATVLGNSLLLGAGLPVWSRTSEGVYRAVLTGAFPENKTNVDPQITQIGSVSNEFSADGMRIDDDTVEIRVFDAGSNLVDGFDDLSITIEVYP